MVGLGEDGFGAAAGVYALCAQHGGQFGDTAVPVQIFYGRNGTAVFHLFAHMEMGVAIPGQLRQMGDDDDLVLANGR